MPQNTRLTAGTTWTLLTNADVSALTAQNRSGYEIELTATNGTTAPSESASGPIGLKPGESILSDLTLAVLFPGVSGANRVWGRCAAGSAAIGVSHA